MESPERSVSLEIPANDGVFACSPPTVPTWLKRRLSEPKTPSSLTVEEIEAKLRDADLRRQKFYEHLSEKARPKPRSPPRSSSNDDDSVQRLKAKLIAAEEKRLSILTSAQMRLAKLHELRIAAKTKIEIRLEQKRAEIGSKLELKVQQAEANRLLILRNYRQKRAALKERTSQFLLQRIARDSKYKEKVRAAMYQKRANAEKKRLGLLEEEKRQARTRFLKVKKVANSVAHEREIKRNEMKSRLEDRIQRARRKRAEYLRHKGGLNNVLHDSWDKADILSRKLARSWRMFKSTKRTTAYLAKAFYELNIKESSVKSLAFEQFALLIQSSSTLHTTKALLDRLEIRYKLSRAVGHTTTTHSHGSDDIDHLLKRVASPKKRTSPRKSSPYIGDKNSPSKRDAPKTSLLLRRYQVRVVLCAYMILGHPDAVISGQGERQTALVKSAEKFVKEFDLLIKVIVDGPQQFSSEESGQVPVGYRTFRSQLAVFDSSWCSFLSSFVVWKAKDAKSLEDDLVTAACRLELSMMQTCKITSEEDRGGPLSHDMKAVQKEVLEDQNLLREKVSHLSGDAGIERMEAALADARTKFFNEREKGSPVTPLSTFMLSQSPSSSSLGSSEKAGEPVDPEKQSSAARSLFKYAPFNEASLSTSGSKHQGASRVTSDMENVRFVHEYVHGEHLSLDDVPASAGSSENVIMTQIRVTMEKAFWDGIITSVRQSEPDYSPIVELMGEVRDGICEMAPLSWRKEISETIDLEILTEVLNCGKLDTDYLGKILEYALFTLQKLSAPANEEELKKKHQTFMKDLAEQARGSFQNSQVVALIEGLRFVLEQIQDLKQEISKARIRLLEPFLKGPDALHFLGKAFVSRYGRPCEARNALPLTARWLSSVQACRVDEWNEHQSFLADLRNKSNSSSPSFLPPTTLRTGGGKLGAKQSHPSSSLSKATTYIDTINPHSECKGDAIDLSVRLGLLKLVKKVAGLTEGELPETMKLNLSRLRRAQSRLQRIIVVTTSLLVLRQTLVSQRIVTSQAHLDILTTNSFNRLLNALDTAEDAGIKEIIDSLASSIDEDSNSSNDVNLEPIKEIMGRMLNKSLQEDDAVFARVSRAVYSALRGVVLGGTGKEGRDLAAIALHKVGAGLLVDDVAEVGSILVVVGKVSVIVHGPWYSYLVKV